MKTALIINFQGKNLIGQFSENNGQLKLENTILDFEHNSPISNIDIMEAFKMVDCQRHDYQQSVIGVGSNYQIVFLSDAEADTAIEMITGKVSSYKLEIQAKINSEEKNEEERISLAIVTAKETNEPVEISRHSYETSGNYIQVVNEITYAMPDGSRKTINQETN